VLSALSMVNIGRGAQPLHTPSGLFFEVLGAL